MAKILVIVESPGKIKKIQDLLGPGYIVMASVGHIIDLDPANMSIDIKNKFTPNYAVIEGKEKVISDLKKAMKTADDVYLASDEDREGEMIAWSLAKELGLKKPKRIAFNSITKAEIDKAIKNPREIDENLVDAQKSRRILDRIVGYEISPILWKSIRASLSAGRVQSVVARLIIDKENEIKEFYQKDSQSFFKFNGVFNEKKKKPFKALLYTSNKTSADKNEEEDDDEITEIEGLRKGGRAKVNSENAKKLLNDMTKSTFKVKNIVEKDSTRHPSAPFTTSTLQQEAAKKLGFTVKRTMTAAQKLYEEGYITYMRTDSVNLSKEALTEIKEFVTSKFGKEYHNEKQYFGKSKNTQEAHEAIRPTHVKDENLTEKKKIGYDEVKLYNLIWRRAVASQMSPAKFKITNIEIEISKLKDYYYLTQIENILFQGFLRVYGFKDVENIGIDIPAIGSVLEVDNITGNEDYERPPPRFNEASLVKKLDPDNLNIGRPSTYASIINKIQERGYVILQNLEGEEKDAVTLCWDGGSKIKETSEKINIGKEQNKLVPTSVGILVNDFLVKNFPEIMDYTFTASMEDELDEIAEGKIKFVKVMDKFYKKFHPVVEKLLAAKKTEIDKLSRSLGKHPTKDLEIIATLARFGPVVKMCESKSKCVYAPIKPPLTIDTITLKDAVKLFEYPKLVGKYEDKPIELFKGKHGFYLKWATTKLSIETIDKIKDKEKITEKEAIELLKEKRKNIYWEGKDGTKQYTILEGPYGKYISIKDSMKPMKKSQNVKLVEEIKNYEELTIDKVKELVNLGYESKYKNKKTKTGDKTTKSPAKRTTKTKKTRQ